MTQKEKQTSTLSPYEKECVADMMKLYGLTRQQAMDELDKLRVYGI